MQARNKYFSSCILHLLEHREEDLKQDFTVTGASKAQVLDKDFSGRIGEDMVDIGGITEKY